MKIDGYKFGTKNNWRRWQWNRVVERLSVKPRDAVVLYLAGKEDLDRMEAVRRKFRSENMIAVDTNLEVVQKLRSQNKVAIHGPLHEVLENWVEPKIDAVIADFTGGLLQSEKLFRHGVSKSNGFIDGCVFAVNMFRGHDPCESLRRIRDWDKQTKLDKDDLMRRGVDKRIIDYVVNLPDYIDPSIPKIKHRGVLLILSIFASIIDQDADSIVDMCMKYGNNYFSSMFHAYTRPAINTYRSDGSAYMDSVVFRFPNKRRIEIIKNKQIGAKIAAAKAVRTMRATGKLPPASMF